MSPRTPQVTFDDSVCCCNKYRRTSNAHFHFPASFCKQEGSRQRAWPSAYNYSLSRVLHSFKSARILNSGNLRVGLSCPCRKYLSALEDNDSYDSQTMAWFGAVIRKARLAHFLLASNTEYRGRPSLLADFGWHGVLFPLQPKEHRHLVID